MDPGEIVKGQFYDIEDSWDIDYVIVAVDDDDCADLRVEAEGIFCRLSCFHRGIINRSTLPGNIILALPSLSLTVMQYNAYYCWSCRTLSLCWKGLQMYIDDFFAYLPSQGPQPLLW